MFVLDWGLILLTVSLEHQLYALKQVVIDDRFVLARIEDAAIMDFPGVEGILEQDAEIALVEAASAFGVPFAGHPPLEAYAGVVERLGRGAQRLFSQVGLKHAFDGDRFLFVDRHPLVVVIDIVSEDRSASDPLALLGHRRHFVAGPLTDDFSFELSEVDQDGLHEAAHGGTGIDVLCDGNEGDAVLAERLEDVDEILGVAGEAVVLVGHDDLEFLLAGIRHQPLNGGPIHIAAGIRCIIVTFRAWLPTFTAPGLDERLAVLPLGVQRGEVRIHVLVGGLTGVNGA
ncbi:MAG: hypothetical protein A2992_06505 [Elusimicrobia bacterium RIFCSPLOWO2_01_FULL_59_12]|nr:MAG: hypothetical protein A2992_06505 [Elusimicrobia bacterium RIFCSPLOWO2_01_FULL_59_12]